MTAGRARALSAPRSCPLPLLALASYALASAALPCQAWHRGDGARLEPAIRGVTIGPIESSQQPGRGYGTPYSEVLLDELVRLGVNAVSLTPFGRLWSLDSTEILMDFELPHDDNRAAVARMITQAKARGMRVLLVPHLWVETGGWRGEIDPGSEAGWLAYQESYRRFVLSWARDAQAMGADALSIGVECTSWSGKSGPYWHALIAEIRSVFKGHVTYSSNWDEVDHVLFWDQLDSIGINAFYPLAHAAGADYGTYAVGAARALDGATDLARTLGMPVLLVEVGYTTRTDAAVEPWLWPDAMRQVPIDEWEQARALHAIAAAAAVRPEILGLFVWRYYANLDDVSQEAAWGFSPHAKLAERVLGTLFRSRWQSDPTAPTWYPMALSPRDHYVETLLWP